eukprot:CAMPEP_0183348312 /NCGR_PEP_ID=MMETSP0164_2-20130417/12854_1 /TAXON_ID=221442 /ORGANISM="Coccolithus pelagicus ssp braarudi, Strain PLY182g" /LENGTH=97 /DNA_ID=CAMNT_0025519879 /DNA_START=251 /DNA_END=544 /DNA_ORIENTATION=+
MHAHTSNHVDMMRSASPCLLYDFNELSALIVGKGSDLVVRHITPRCACRAQLLQVVTPTTLKLHEEVFGCAAVLPELGSDIRVAKLPLRRGERTVRC